VSSRHDHRLRGARVLAALACLAVTFAALGVGAARLWAHRRAEEAAAQAAQAYREARRTRETAGRAAQSAISSLFHGEDAKAEEALAGIPASAGGYVAYLRLGLALRRGDLDTAPALLTASGEPWDVFTDVCGLPGSASIDRELAVFRRLTDDLCEALTTGGVPGGAAGLARVRAAGNAAARAWPPDVVHLQLGAYMRARAGQSLLSLAKSADNKDAIVICERAFEQDRAWQTSINRRTLETVRSLPMAGELSESDWTASLRAEAASVQELLTEMPE
jgi:hypothetical protein